MWSIIWSNFLDNCNVLKSKHILQLWFYCENCDNLQISEKLAEARAEIDAAIAMSTATSKFLSKIAVAIEVAIGFVYYYVYCLKWQK